MRNANIFRKSFCCRLAHPDFKFYTALLCMDTDLIQFLIIVYLKWHIVTKLNNISSYLDCFIDQIMRCHYMLRFNERSGTTGKTICERTDSDFMCYNH